MKTDGDLLRSYVSEHSQTAFAELVERHVGLVFHAALRRANQNTALAEEITQLIFTSVAREASKLSHHSALTGWLYVATRHAAAKAMRSEMRRRQYVEEFSDMQITGRSEDSDVDWVRLKPVLDELMDSLSENDREAVLLRFFEGQAYGEIGAALCVSEDAARVRVNRALEKLRALLAKRGIKSTAAVLGGLLAGNAAMAAPVGLAASVSAGAVATASAATLAGAAGAGILTFMTTTKWTVGIACVVTATSVGTALYQHSAQAAAQAEVMRLTGDARRLTQRLDELERARTEADAKAQATARELAQQQLLQKSSSDAAAKTSDASSTQAGATAAAREKADKAKAVALADGREFITTNSQGRAMVIDIGRAQIARNYAGFYRMATLTPAQIEEFENATNAHWLATIVMTPTSIQPSESNLPSEKAREILGEAGFAQFEQFRRLQPLQGMVTQVSSLSPEAPLSRDQSAQLLTILANASTTYQAGGKADPKTIDWNRAEAQAQSVLNAHQLEGLRAQSQLPSLMILVKEFYEKRTSSK